MIFKGADGFPYEVRGDAGSVFNLVSSPRLSINALFMSVPPQFPVRPSQTSHPCQSCAPRPTCMPRVQTMAVGDTVLGDLGIALCGPEGGAAVHLHLDVATGNLSLAHAVGSSPYDVVAAASAVGAAIRIERFLCNLEHMNCTWVDVGGAVAASAEGGETGLALPLMDSGHSRVHMQNQQLGPRPYDPLKLSIARRAPARPCAGPPRQNVLPRCISAQPRRRPRRPATPARPRKVVSCPVRRGRRARARVRGRNALVAPDTDVDCEDFSAWAAAAQACAALISGTAPPERREEWALLLTMPYLDAATQRFHLVQLDVPPVTPTPSRLELLRIQRQAHSPPTPTHPQPRAALAASP